MNNSNLIFDIATLHYALEYTFKEGEWVETCTLPDCPPRRSDDRFDAWLEKAGYSTQCNGKNTYETFVGSISGVEIYTGRSGWLACIVFMGGKTTFVRLLTLPDYFAFKKELIWLGCPKWNLG